jgi:hypothetical protein
MYGTDIALNHQVATIRYNEMLDEAARQRALSEAFDLSPRLRRNRISEARALIASALLRAGSWLMPDDGCGNAASRGLELRLGR